MHKNIQFRNTAKKDYICTTSPYILDCNVKNTTHDFLNIGSIANYCMATKNKSSYAIDYDLSNCDKEPIHFIRHVQPHGCLLIVDPTTTLITNVSSNASLFFGQSSESVLHTSIYQLLPDPAAASLKEMLAEKTDDNLFFRYDHTIKGKKRSWYLLAHINSQESLVITIEPSEETNKNFDPLISTTKAIHQITSDPTHLLQNASQAIKTLTGYDRVMIYKFDEAYNGQVVAETTNPGVDSFLGQHYPASDIPEQARAAYFNNKVRVIVDTDASPAILTPALNAKINQPVNIGGASLRGSSPIHIEYLKNMKVGASMTAAIIIDQQLWGLVACHHLTAKYVSYPIRQLVSLICDTIASQLSLTNTKKYKNRVLQIQLDRSKLFAKMDEKWDLIKALTVGKPNILNFNSATGAAIYLEESLTLVGKTPEQEKILKLIQWLNKTKLHTEKIFYTHNLCAHFAPALQYASTGSGILAVSLFETNQSVLLWFKPEVIQTIEWGGNIEQQKKTLTTEGRINPRKSFEKWEQKVANSSIKWTDEEIDASIALKNDIKDYIVKKYKQVKRLNEEITYAYDELQTFSYTISHDLRAPLRIIKGYAKILIEDFKDELNQSGTQVVNMIIENAKKMEHFIGDILSYSKVGQRNLLFVELDFKKIVEDCWNELILLEDKERRMIIDIDTSIPYINGDRILISQLVYNLISNAIKYTRKTEEAIVKVIVKEESNFQVISVIDNGIGFDNKYKEELFSPFNRFVTAEEFEGTGVGMAIAKRIVTLHQGEIWARCEKGVGTTFTFKLPLKK